MHQAGSSALPLPTSPAAERIGSSAVRDILRVTEQPHVLSLAGGLPAPDLFPTAALAEAAAATLAEDGPGALQYGPTEGYEPLRRWIADRRYGEVDEVLVTTGSQQGLDLVARALLGAGDVVAVADPTYVGALQAWRLVGAQVVPVPADAAGLDVDALAAMLAGGLRPQVVYVVANLHNPTGATLPDGRRRALAVLADRYGFVIVDDDPYGDLRWGGPPATPLRALSARVLTLGSFSKVLAPGLRVGYLVGDRELVRALAVCKQAVDLHTPSWNQRVVEHVVGRPGFLGDHLDRLRLGYRERAVALVDALGRHLGDRLRTTVPTGGLFCWATLPGVDTAALLPLAVDHGVAFVPGAAFAVADPATDRLRLSFATLTPAEADEAVRRLAAAVGAVDAAGAAAAGVPDGGRAGRRGLD